jgi:Uma2 family endonuclease
MAKVHASTTRRPDRLNMGKPSRTDELYERFRAVPKYKVAEIIRGDLVTHPRPAARHANAASALAAELFGPFARGKNGPGGWVILVEPELHLAQDILVPDLAGWRRERMPELLDVAWFELAPDWICEVLSPSTAAIDRADKLPIYARHDVSYAWLVDPLAQTLEVLQLDSKQWGLVATHRNDARVRAEPFQAVEFELSTLWAK